jgi:hypothetical protein
VSLGICGNLAWNLGSFISQPNDHNAHDRDDDNDRDDDDNVDSLTGRDIKII